MMSCNSTSSVRLALCILIGAILVSTRTTSAFYGYQEYSGQADSNEDRQDTTTTKATSLHQYQPFSEHTDPSLRLYKIPNTLGDNITCNDGSPIGHYMRLNGHSKSWVIFLESGGFCSTNEACAKRWQQWPEMMSSNQWPQSRTVDGILSSRPKDNPYLWNANHIYIPYCSSDAYSGLKPASQSSGRYDQSYSFMGSKIIERIMISLFDDLPQELSLYEAKSVLLAGESAGALGVMLNLDKVNDMINRKFSSYRTNCASSNSKCDPLRKAPVVRGLADSGWFVDNEPLALPLDHNNQNDGDKVSTYSDTDSISFSPEQMIMQSVSHWNGQVPIECSSRYRNKPWLCYFGYRLYQTLRTPLFVVQWLYDGYQLMADNVYPPYNEVQWSYIRKYGNQMRKSLENVTALFAPSCLSHTLITKPGWNKITVNGFKLPHVLNNWEEQSLVQSPELEAQSSTVRLTTDNPARDDTDSMIQAHFLNSQSGRENLQPMIQDRHLTFRSANSRSSSPNGRTRTNRKRRRNNQNQPKSRQHTSIAAISSTDSNLSPAQGALNQPHPIGGAIREILPLVESDGPTDLIVGRLNLDAINGRQGRSTPMMDDATVVLGNTVPDDSQQASNVDLTTFSSSQPASWLTKEWVVIKEQDTSIRPRTVATKKTYSSSPMDRFRHVDSCTWPQCNRDCADLESHPYSGVLASF